ncbi:type II secretion system F family protein [Prauserella cavernicola]|uniref:Type II secretion system F family protein n=1 Tax=Prauserella cavernicola TaxID=2800127 RepID=A0A934QTP2_9PSEU|nr:type II secretion system F family protein [Prauserella cavernicola]MBK1785159.1 type II secretion system F family protein [Prauserella cavernicola]
MLTGAAISAALGLLCWPRPSSTYRLAALGSPKGPGAGIGRLRSRQVMVPVVVLSSALAAMTVGPAVAVALVLLAGAAIRQFRARREERQKVAAAAALGEAVRTMVGELRAGAHPAVAAEAAAVDADARTADVLRAVAASARLGGDLDAVLPRSVPGRHDVLDDVLAQLGNAWALARDHGLPLATVLDAVQRDVDAKVRLANQVDARMAGPRASSAILAALPAGGILLGQAMGAEPLHVLATTTAGQVLLVLGAALILAGVCWSAVLTGRVVPR